MTPTRAVDALLFDLGNVLIEIDFGRIFAAWAAAGRTSAAVVATRFVAGEDYAAHERGELGTAAYFASVRRDIGLDIDDDCLARGWNEVFVGEMAGARALLGALQGRVPMFALTNTNPVHRAYWLAHYGDLLEPLSAVFASCDLGHRKPSPQAYATVSREIGVAPSRIGFFDDLDENVIGARAIGMQAFRVRSRAEIDRALDALGLGGGSA